MECNAENFMKIIGEFTSKSPSDIDPESELKSLVSDSFMLVELVMNLQEDLGVRINQEDLMGVTKVNQLQDVFLAKKS